MNTTTLTLADLTTRTGIDVFDYLERSIAIPVTDRPQAQGDLLVIPHAMVTDAVTTRRWSQTLEVGTSGIELLRSAAGGNPHTLVSDAGICTWTTAVIDERGLALGILDTDVTAYLIHPEHGATGIAPGHYVIRRQREFTFGFGAGSRGFQLVAD